MIVNGGCEYRTVRVGHNNFCIDRRYSGMKVIGTGSYGVVLSAIDKVTGRKVAIKKVKDVFCDTEEAKRILRELKLLHHFSKHENVIQLIDIMSFPPTAEKIEDIYIVTNFMDRDLGRIIDSKQVFSDQHLQYFLYQILRGVKFVHSANVLHRDLKPENIVVNLNCDLALCDFGLARGFDAEVGHLTEYVVTRHYRPPELLLECSKYGKPLDVWSVGCIFAELILRKVLFCGDTPQHQLRLIVEKIGLPSHDKLAFIDSREAMRELHSIPPSTPPPFHSLFPPNTNTQALDLLQQMLRFAPNERITVEDALAHVYLRDFHDHMSEPVCEKLFDFGFEKQGVMGEELSDAEVRRLMYEEMCKFRPERHTAQQSTRKMCGTNNTSSSGSNSSSTSTHNSPCNKAHNTSTDTVDLNCIGASAMNVSTSSISSDTSINTIATVPDVTPSTTTATNNSINTPNTTPYTTPNTTINTNTINTNTTTAAPNMHLHLACSTDQSTDLDESVRTIELFTRSVSSSLCTDSMDTSMRSTGSHGSMHSVHGMNSVVRSNSIHSVFSVSQDSYPCVGIASVGTESSDKDTFNTNNTARATHTTDEPDRGLFTHSTSNHLESVFSMSTDPYPSVGIANMADTNTRRQSEGHVTTYTHALPPAGHRHNN